MRSSLGLAAILLLSCLASAAEPAKVSVYPTQPVVTGTLVAPPATPRVLAGTLVPVVADDPKPVPAAKPADKPMAPAGKDVAPVAPALVPPTVSAVSISSCGACGACDATPCGTPLFRGRLFAASCGADVCDSPGRPTLFGGSIGKSCSGCDSSGPCCPRAHALLARFRAWLMFRPCDGPRVGLFRCEPYVSRTMTVFACKGCDVGTCHAAASCVGSPGRGGFGRLAGACATGTGAAGACAADGCRGGMPTGPLEKLALFHHRVPQDCTNCEPKLSGSKFDACYHFASAIPKSYGCRTTRINPISGCVTTPGEGVATDGAKDVVKPAAEPTKIERAAATLPVPHPLPASRPAKAVVTPAAATGEIKTTNPLKTPFSNP